MYLNYCLKPFSFVRPMVNPSPWISHAGPRGTREKTLPGQRSALSAGNKTLFFFQNAVPGTPQDCPNSSLCFKQLISSLIFVTPAVDLRCLRAALRVTPGWILAVLTESSPLVFPNNAFLSEIQRTSETKRACLPLAGLRSSVYSTCSQCCSQTSAACSGARKENEAAGSGHPSAAGAAGLDSRAWTGGSNIQRLGFAK